MTSWSKEEITISASTKVLAQMPVIVQGHSASRLGCEVSLKESLAALIATQKSLMKSSLAEVTKRVGMFKEVMS